MAQFERIRDVISGPFNPSILQERTASGWQLVSIEWRRELPMESVQRESAGSLSPVKIIEENQRCRIL